MNIGEIIIEDLFELQGAVAIAASATNVSAYDLNFRSYFETRSIIRATELPLVLRVGAIHDYDAAYTSLKEEGFTLINSIEEHNRASLLPNWYPLISELTPRTVWFQSLPTVKEVTAEFNWPVFIKGERQTNRHRKSLCIANNENEFETIMNYWKQDPILGWQKVICREFIKLEKIEEAQGDKVQMSNEYRVFVWKGNVAGLGRYWESNAHSELNAADERLIRNLVETVAERVRVPFLVVDVARTEEGKWIVIELNDAQESGYAGVNKLNLWSNIVSMEA